MRTRRILALLFSVAVTLAIAIACDQPSQPAATSASTSSSSSSSAAQTATPTIIPSPNPTELWYLEHSSSMSAEDLDWLRVHDPEKYAYFETGAKNDEDYATKIALTPKTGNPGPPPTDTPGPPPPTPTLIMGMLSEACGQLAGPSYWFHSCWRGLVNGQLVSVAAGGEKTQPGGGKGQPTPPPPAAVFLVFHGPYLLGSDDHPEVYRVTSSYGLGIQSVDGTRFVLVPLDNYYNVVPGGKTLVFDLATRQFVSS